VRRDYRDGATAELSKHLDRPVPGYNHRSGCSVLANIDFRAGPADTEWDKSVFGRF
jgi:hypothetical protein